MDIIGKSFSTTQGNARAACATIDSYLIGLITKGDDADEVVATFKRAAEEVAEGAWDPTKEIWDKLETDSPILMYCRNRWHEEYGIGKIYYRNIDFVKGSYPDSAHLLESRMFGLMADMMSVRRELFNSIDFIELDKFNRYPGRDVILLSTADYNREQWEGINISLVEAITPLCCDNPEEHWSEVERLLREAIDPCEAYVVIVDGDTCRARMSWNVKEGEPTEHRVKIDWSKVGWALMNSEWNEHTSDTIQAKCGRLAYEGFDDLCIKEIAEDRMVFILGEDRHILTRGEGLSLRYNDSFEDHEGVEWRDINYSLDITWLDDNAE